MRLPLRLLALLVFSVPVFAGTLKYKSWPQSPEGYFMTKAERQQWAGVDSDSDAAKFIAAFRAKRPEYFSRVVADRAKNADKYLSIGKTKGSRSLRGKVIILLGPPTSMDVSEEPVTNSEKRDNPAVSSMLSNMNNTQSSPGSINNTILTPLSTSTVVRMIHFNYQGETAKTADRRQIDVSLEVDPISGHDRISSHHDEADLDQIFETVAQSWIRK